MAPADSIATSEHTRTLCEGYFALRALGPMAIRGISEAINVYEVTGLGPLRTHFELAAQRGLTKFVGRERELEQMQRALDLAMSGHGQVVAAVAEAGIGKSRPFHEFKATIPAACKVLEAYSVSHGRASAWLPVLELLRDYFRIQDTDDAVSYREKVRAGLSALDHALDDTLPYLFRLLGIIDGPDPIAQMHPQIKRQRTLDAIKRIVLREGLDQPLVVIFEDCTGSTSRPSRCSAKALNSIRSKRLIAERTGGNPFFIEEIVQALFDEGALVRNGAVKVTRSLSQLRLPPTVNASSPRASIGFRVSTKSYYKRSP
jgi:predicted ATPase